jgi:hypothetical protein
MKNDVLIAFMRKRRQRMIEYVVLIGLQTALALMLLREVQFVFLLVFTVSAFGVAFNVTKLREQRRTLGLHSTKRLLGDTIESFAAMLIILVAGITARLLSVPMVSFFAHLAVIVWAYFCGSFTSETLWTRHIMPSLTAEQQTQYVHNLNRSIIFPYNIPYLRSVLRSRRPSARSSNDSQS